MQIHGVLVKKIRENIEEREQAGALVATRCTSILLSTVRVRFWQTALQTNTKLIHIYMFLETLVCLLSKYV